MNAKNCVKLILQNLRFEGRSLPFFTSLKNYAESLILFSKPTKVGFNLVKILWKTFVKKSVIIIYIDLL